MKVIIEKHLLDQVLEICKILENADPVEESNWIDSVPEKHRKFATYWDEIGRPELEFENTSWPNWYKTKNPDWEADNYRIKDDPHWELRLKWVNSSKTLPIEIYDSLNKNWQKLDHPMWYELSKYREANPWYEQEISEAKPILLKGLSGVESIWHFKPPDHLINNYKPLTDQEIDALKRGL